MDNGKLLTPFAQFHQDKSGRGLGLAICKRIVQANHGVVSVHNHEGMGCAFTIDLPRYTGSGTVAPASRELPAVNYPPGFSR